MADAPTPNPSAADRRERLRALPHIRTGEVIYGTSPGGYRTADVRTLCGQTVAVTLTTRSDEFTNCAGCRRALEGS